MTRIAIELDAAEDSLQEWFRVKPPPFYVERRLCRAEGLSAETYWNELVSRMNPFMAHLHTIPNAIRCSDRISIGQLNEYGYQKQLDKLQEAQDRLSGFLSGHKCNLTLPQRANGLDRLGYMRTETSLAWAASVVPQLQLNPNDSKFLKALEICAIAAQLALSCSDYFSASRASYNVGRIKHELAKDIYDAILALNKSFMYCETHVARHGIPDDYEWWNRRLDILHRLVELCSQHSDAAIAVEDHVQFLKSPSIGRLKAKAPTIEHVIKDGVEVRVVNLPSPWGARLSEIYGQLDDATALLSYVHGRRYTTLTLVHKSNAFFKMFDPDLIHLDGWDAFFRPIGLDFQASIHGWPEDANPNAIAVDFGRFVQADVTEVNSEHILEWSIGRDILEVTPRGPKDWTCLLKKETMGLHSSVRWQNRLYEILIAPIKQQLDSLGVKHLVVNPDGGLNLVPFHLLSRDGTFLCDDYLISYVPNLPVLSSSLSQPPRSTESPNVLIVEDSTGSLPWSANERDLVASNFESSRVHILAGEAATIDNLRSAICQADIVHFCTHGRFDTTDLDHSGLLLADQKWLTLADIESLTLRAGALVFLSACETGRIKLTSRIDSLGISHSFLGVGAKTVICTFWEVDDVSTALFAAQFYHEYIANRRGALDSLHDSQRWLRELRADDARSLVSDSDLPDNSERPFHDFYYWGPFALYGDWR